MTTFATLESGYDRFRNTRVDPLSFLNSLGVLLLLAAAMLPTPAHAQTSRAATNHEAFQKVVQDDVLPADLQAEPLRQRLRAALGRAKTTHPVAARGSRAIRDAVNRILAASLGHETTLTAGDGVAGDHFGWSVAIDGDRALAGAPFNGMGQNAAYSFAFDGTTWTERARLTASGGELLDFFGWSVAINGDRALVGAPFDAFGQGAAYVFSFDGAAWTQQAKLTAADGAAFDQFGISVSLDGDRALVGAFGDEAFAGAAYVFAFDGTTWTEQAKLVSADLEAGDDVGVSVSLDGDRALVGADGEDDHGAAAGAAYVFAFDGAAWTQQAKLTAGDGEAFEFFGQAVSLDGNRALIGATLDDENGMGSGSAYVFTFNGTAWTQQAKLLATDGEAGDDFGLTVSLSGDQALIGAVGDDDHGASAGAAYVFAFDGTAWTQEEKLTAGDGAANDFYGLSVSLDGNRALIGSPGHTGGIGAAYAFASDAPPAPPPHPFLFLADEKILLSGQLASVGDLHSNGAIEIKKGNPSTHVGNLTAVGDIKIDKSNTIDGDVTAGGTVERKGNATVTGTITEHAEVDPIPLPDLSFSAGGAGVSVNTNRTLVLPPGAYGDLEVDANATLMLSSGEYFFTQAAFKQGAVLSADVSGGPVTINVVGDVLFEKDTALDIVPLGEAGSTLVRINTLGDLVIKKDAHILGTILAPEGTVTVDKDGFLKGLICARQIEVKKDGTLLFHGATPPAMPASEHEAATPQQLQAGPAQETPETYRLTPNYPNPFNPMTTIAFALPETTPVRLVVYDVTGRAVAHLVERSMGAGTHEVRFDASALPGGVYLYQITAGSFTETRRMVLVK